MNQVQGFCIEGVDIRIEDQVAVADDLDAVNPVAFAEFSWRLEHISAPTGYTLYCRNYSPRLLCHQMLKHPANCCDGKRSKGALTHRVLTPNGRFRRPDFCVAAGFNPQG